jgi:hypothetical protein
LTIRYARRRRVRRNPGGGRRMFGGLLAGVPPLKRIAAGAAGAAAVRIIPGYLSRLMPTGADGQPMIPTTGIVGIGVKALGSLLMGGLASRFLGKQFGEDFTFGAFVVLADEAARAYIYPPMGLNAYLYDDTGVAAYLSPGQTVPSLGGPGGYYNPDDYGYGSQGSPSLSGTEECGRLNADNRL